MESQTLCLVDWEAPGCALIARRGFQLGNGDFAAIVRLNKIQYAILLHFSDPNYQLNKI